MAKSKKEETPEYKRVIKDKQKILKQYLREKDYAIKLRQVKINGWIENEESFNLIGKKTLLTRSNLHNPVVFEGVQNMGSKLGALPECDFDTIPEGDENASEIMKHVVKQDLDDCNAELIYEQSKTEGGIYGRTIYKVIPGNDKQTVELVDTLAYLISPIAKDTKSALYQGQQFIYKTIEQIEDEAEEMGYDMEEVKKLKEHKEGSETQVLANSEASLKNIRMANMSLANVTNYGSKVFEITEWVTYIKGVLSHLTVANDIYLLRAIPSIELGLTRPNFCSWGTYPRGITFWCLSVADIYRDPNLAVDVNMNQQIDNNTYRNFGMAFVSSRSGLKQSSINPRPLGLTTIQCAPGEKISDQIFYPPVPEIGQAMQVMQTIKGMADSASGLSPNINPGKGGKISVTMQAKLNAEVEEKIKVMRKNVTNCWQEIYQLMADITTTKMTKPRKVKIFGYKNLTLSDVTKANFKDVTLVARAIPSEDSSQNKAIKQKAKIDLYTLFKDDPKIPGQLALRRSVAKTFDIDPEEIEAYFTQEDAPKAEPGKMPGGPVGGADVSGKAPSDATPLISATASGAANNVPKMI